jgi:hypothetical protein
MACKLYFKGSATFKYIEINKMNMSLALWIFTWYNGPMRPNKNVIDFNWLIGMIHFRGGIEVVWQPMFIFCVYGLGKRLVHFLCWMWYKLLEPKHGGWVDLLFSFILMTLC